MNEKVMDFFKVSRFWLIVGAVLLAWAIGGTIAGVYFHDKHKSLRTIIDNAGGDELVDLIQQHGTGLVSQLEDISAIRGEVESANGRAAELEQQNGRAYEYALLTDGELVKFGSTMASSGNTLQDSIKLQQRTIEFVERIERNNNAIKAELGGGP